MRGSHAVLDLAQMTAPLPLDAGSLGLLLGEGGFIHESHAGSVRQMFGRNDPLHLIAQCAAIPLQMSQKLLQRMWQRARSAMDSTLLRGKSDSCPDDIPQKQLRRSMIVKATLERLEKPCQLRQKRPQQLFIHAAPPGLA